MFNTTTITVLPDDETFIFETFSSLNFWKLKYYFES